MKNRKIIIIVSIIILIVIGVVVYMQFIRSSNDVAEPQNLGTDNEYSNEETKDPSIYDETITSCDEITSFGLCTDFIGSFWRTPAMEKNICGGQGVYNKKNTCEQPALGGCRLFEEVDRELIIWYYDSVNDTYDDPAAEVKKYCNLLGGQLINN